jgi:hypothetical protein
MRRIILSWADVILSALVLGSLLVAAIYVHVVIMGRPS